ncbi:hypothetical protein FA10DRAFT_233011 [Acaromyces ingoldii]|uniref:Rad52/22 double-strand break repair protein n=1 Tax=Acaromyces ingoldii TaxID=215250 RepID=A0A316YGW7_9BASI|nr:hypothetical protein FA10DRAFT_233011 [Acaromyces ingoldii]PWN88094.1 hypothetical protein FA10DRAFT_233011 [Acaromyces ingoldii]
METGKPRHSLGEGYVHTKGEVEEQQKADAKVALLASSTNHGSSNSNQRKDTYGFYPASSISDPGADGARQIALLQSALSKRLGPEYISTRSGPSGGGKLFYLEGWKVIDLANEVFGFNGWCSSVMKLDIDFVSMDELPNNRFNVGVTSVVRITLRDGTFHEDVGYGSSENSPKKSQALEKAKKEAVTDALKRAMRTFGRLLGNCVYDKKFVEKASKMRANPVSPSPDVITHWWLTSTSFY